MEMEKPGDLEGEESARKAPEHAQREGQFEGNEEIAKTQGNVSRVLHVSTNTSVRELFSGNVSAQYFASSRSLEA